MASSTFELVIKPRTGWQPVDWRELWVYRELLGFLVWRDIKIRYKQTVLGGVWAVIQPLAGMLVFAGLFNRVANIQSDGSPYPLFVFAGLVPWTFFANAVGLASNSLVGSEHMIRKTYFPRLLLPLGTIGALGLDVIISLGFMGALMAYYRWPPSSSLVWLPLIMFCGFLTAGGIGLILSALNVRFRDVKYVVPFLTQMAFFLTPVLYPIRHVPGKLKMFIALNPMTGIVEGFRYAILGGPVAWSVVWTAMGASMLLFVVGLYFFRRMERTFADII